MVASVVVQVFHLEWLIHSDPAKANFVIWSKREESDFRFSVRVVVTYEADELKIGQMNKTLWRRLLRKID